MHRNVAEMKIYFVLFACSVFASFVYAYDPEGWSDASAHILNGLDLAHNPCENFYRFSCGKRLPSNINDNSTDGGVAKEAETRKSGSELLAFFKIALSEVNKNSSNHDQWLNQFYTKCHENSYENSHDLYSDILKNLAEFFANFTGGNRTGFGPVDDSTDFWNIIGRLQREQNTHFLIEAYTEAVEIGCKSGFVLHLRPAQVFAPKNERYDSFFGNQSALNNDSSEARAQNEVLDYAKMYDRGGATAQVRRLKLGVLRRLFPGISWASYLTGLLSEKSFMKWSKDDPYVVIQDTFYFGSFLPQLLERYSFESLLSLAHSQLVSEYYVFFKGSLKSGARDEDEMKADAASDDEEDKCFEMAIDYFSAAAANLILKALPPSNVDEWSYDIEIIADAVFSAFKFLINGFDWLDADERMTLIRKVNRFSVFTGLPSWIMNDIEVNRRTPKYDPSLTLLENDIKAQKRLFYQEVIRPLIQDDHLFLNPASQVAPKFSDMIYYSGEKINILFGALISPIYQYIAPLGVKLSRLGWILARELLKAFDQSLYRFDIDEEIAPERQRLYNRTLGKVEQYQYCANIGFGINHSEKTRIFEAESLQIAHLAYKFLTQTKGIDPPLPKLVRFNGDQIFFISAAQMICDLDSRGKTDELGFTAGESAELKINKRLMGNYATFAESFGCSIAGNVVESDTNNTEQCSMWF